MRIFHAFTLFPPHNFTSFTTAHIFTALSEANKKFICANIILCDFSLNVYGQLSVLG
jgi:hypothetical protein